MGHGMLVWSLPDHYPFPQTTLPRYLTGEAGAAWEGPWINLDTFNTDLGLHADFAGHTGSGAQTVYYGGSHLALPTLS